ncbi:MAG: hypothetical protein BGN97_03755 [Microbacterium sp. 69-10]|nr:MAG: hypothetical protein BGN97_03755 [Microbacterium sp. 69-10]
MSEQARRVLASGVYDITWTADLLYDGTPRAQNLPLLDPRFSWDGGAKVQGRGSCGILWSDVFGQSIVPREIGDLFSPFGAELQADVILAAGRFSERIPMGRFVLDRVPSGVEYAVTHPRGGVPVVVESQVQLDLWDSFMRVARDGFPFPTSPKSTSMWDEAQRLTGLPVYRSLADRTLPQNLTYEQDRLDALEAIFATSNAWPALTPQGALTAMPKDWPSASGRIEGLLDAPLEMRSENVYNRVVVEGKNPDPQGAPLIAVRELTDGLLRVRNPDGSRSPFGGNTYRYSSDFLTTQAQCDAYADEQLPRVSRIRAVTRTVTEPFNPLREVGDVYTLVDPSRQGEESTVRVRRVEHAGATTALEVEVAP